jgi:membrane-associated phospholipid phosphatase
MMRLARWLSIAAHPFVMVGLMVGAAAARQKNGEVLRSLLIVVIFTIVPLFVLVVRQVRRGAWTNADASNISERPMLYLVGGIAMIALLAYLYFTRPESFLIRGSFVTFAMLGVCGVATRWVKVSLHLAFAALAATTLILIGSPLGWPLLAAVPALMWSRLTLGRHTAAEVASGTAIGVVAGLALALA